MAKLIGNAPNQVPTNADLGSMAFEDRTNYITKNNPIHQPYRNIIINGDMSIAQRGTSSSGITGGNYTVDRFRYTKSGSSPTFTISQDTNVPTGQGFAKSLKLEVTTVSTTDSVDYGLITQKFEGQNLQYLKKGTSNTESLTLSFWVKATKTGTYIVRLDDSDNTRQISQAYTINSSNTWEKKTITYAGDTSGALDNDNNQSLSVEWCLYSGASYSSGTLATSWESTTNVNKYVGQVDAFDTINNTWQITGVQLEAGTTASDFEFLPYDVNLRRCQRYYHKYPNSGSNIGASYNGSSASFFIYFPTTMRATPTTSSASGSDYYRFYRLSSYDSITSLGDNGKSEEYMSFSFATTSAAGTGGELSVRSGGVLEAEAEL